MDKKKGNFTKVIQCFFQVNRKSIPLFAAVIIMLVLSSVLQVIVNYYIGGLIDNLTNWDQKRFLNSAIIILAVQVIFLALYYISNYSASKVSEVSVRNIRVHTYNCLMNASMKWIDEVKIGDIISRVNLDLEAMVNMVNHFLTWEISNIVMFVVGVVTCCILNWKLTIVSILAFPILGLLQIVIGSPITKYSKERAASEGKANAKFMDLVGGHAVAKVFDRESLVSKYIEDVNACIAAGKKSTSLELGLYPIQALISFVPYIVMYSMSAYLISQGEFTIGGMVAFTLVFLSVSNTINSLAGQIRFILDSVGLSSRIFELWDIESESLAGSDDWNSQNDYVVFSDVKFSYAEHAKEERMTLDGVSFKVQKGQQVAIVGHSGEGKSTLFKLLLGIYDNYSGNISIFGNNIKDLNVSKIREHISYVGQNMFLLQDSIYQNVKLGNLNASDEEVMNVIHMFGLDNLDIQKDIGDHGVKISGGQKQRICLARAFLKDADLIILDEPTSALDTESEYYVSKAINEYLKGKTCIIIAHRLSSIRNVDKILCLQKGKIIEEGSFHELMERDSITRKMFLNQIREVNDL